MDALKRKMEIAAVAFFCTVTALIAAYSCATTAAANLAQQTAATEYVTLAYMEAQPEAEQEPELLYQAAKKKATGLNCRKDLQAQRFLVADLRKASERFAKLAAQKERLAEVKERIKAIDEELETIPANIESLEADRFVVEDELKKLRQNAAELASIEAQLSDVKKYIELEKLLPAAEAKKSAAQTRLTELLTYAEKTRTAIDGINAEILTLAKAQADVDELKEQYRQHGRRSSGAEERGLCVEVHRQGYRRRHLDRHRKAGRQDHQDPHRRCQRHGPDL